ncbi:hypothetical protein SFRURICE_008908 [Spodoptera frugiperda]|nr:hypothetical protein SFRURICE_008908 [Spodoptera frugiperda]
MLNKTTKPNPKGGYMVKLIPSMGKQAMQPNSTSIIVEMNSAMIPRQESTHHMYTEHFLGCWSSCVIFSSVRIWGIDGTVMLNEHLNPYSQKEQY